MKTKLKMLAATTLVMLGSAANATPFYLDNGIFNGGVGVRAAGPTTTGVFNEANYRYNSYTTVTDSDNSGTFSAGDAVLGTGGLLKAPGQFTSHYSENYITSLTPAPAGIGNPTGPAGNGFGGSWGLSLGWNDLMGTVNAFGGIFYTSGTIHIYYFDATHPNGVIALDFHVTSGGNNGIGQSLDLNGFATVANPDVPIGTNTLRDLFHFSDGESFDDVTTISVSSNQNTDPFFINGNGSPASIIPPNFFATPGGTGSIEGIHDGSVTFAQTVPEPG